MANRSTICQLAAALLLLAVATAPAAAQGPAPAPAPVPAPALQPAAAPAFPPPGAVLTGSGAVTNAAGGQHYRVCTSDFPPMSTCNMSTPATNFGEQQGGGGGGRVGECMAPRPLSPLLQLIASCCCLAQPAVLALVMRATGVATLAPRALDQSKWN